MNPTLKRYALSSLTTFVTVAVSTLAIQLNGASPITWTLTFWTAIGLTVVRAAFKAVIEGFSGTTADA